MPFSKKFIEEVQEESQKNTSDSFEFLFGSTSFVISRLPLTDDVHHVFQGHVGEDSASLFVYLKMK